MIRSYTNIRFLRIMWLVNLRIIWFCESHDSHNSCFAKHANHMKSLANHTTWFWKKKSNSSYCHEFILNVIREWIRSYANHKTFRESYHSQLTKSFDLCESDNSQFCESCATCESYDSHFCESCDWCEPYDPHKFMMPIICILYELYDNHMQIIWFADLWITH